MNDQLRGCIGNIESKDNIYKQINEVSIKSAFEDMRFNKLTLDELKHIDIEITLLGEKKLLDKNSQRALIKWNVKKDGIILLEVNSGKKAIYLPEVAKSFNNNKKLTIESLSKKAGLNKDDWKNKSIKIYKIPGYKF